MIKRKLSGPSWLKIKSVIPASINEKASWCKQEYIVQNPKNVSVDQDNQSCPNFCAMALNIKTVLNPKTKANEIVMLSWLIHRSSKPIPLSVFFTNWNSKH
jgi:DNA polymerase alpha subunit A